MRHSVHLSTSALKRRAESQEREKAHLPRAQEALATKQQPSSPNPSPNVLRDMELLRIKEQWALATKGKEQFSFRTGASSRARGNRLLQQRVA